MELGRIQILLANELLIGDNNVIKRRKFDFSFLSLYVHSERCEGYNCTIIPRWKRPRTWEIVRRQDRYIYLYNVVVTRGIIPSFDSPSYANPQRRAYAALYSTTFNRPADIQLYDFTIVIRMASFISLYKL